MRARTTDFPARFARALRANAAEAGIDVDVMDSRARPWASATFAGERVTLRLVLAGDPAAWLGALGQAELPMRGCLVADLEVLRTDGASAVVEALVLESA